MTGASPTPAGDLVPAVPRFKVARGPARADHLGGAYQGRLPHSLSTNTRTLLPL